MRPLNKRPTTQYVDEKNTPSAQIFRQLLEAKSKPQPLSDDDYYPLIRRFLNAALNIHTQHLYASDREGQYGHDDPFFANVILLKEIIHPVIFSTEDIEYFQTLFWDDRFFIFTGLLESWGYANSEKLCHYFVNLPQVNRDEKTITVSCIAKNLYEMIGLIFCEDGHWGYDLISIMTAQEPVDLYKRHHYNRYLHMQDQIGKLSPHIRWEEQSHATPRFDKVLTRFADDYLPLIMSAHQLMADIVQDQYCKPSLLVSKFIVNVFSAYETYTKNTNIEYHEYHHQTLESILYKELFLRASPLRDFNREQLSEFFYHLIYTLYSVSDNVKSTALAMSLSDTYAGSDARTLKEIKKSLMSGPVREIYHILLALIPQSVSFSSSSDKLADLYLKHIEVIKRLEAREDALSANAESYHEDSSALVNDYHQHRTKFYEAMYRQKQINSDTYQILRHHEIRLQQYSTHYKEMLSKGEDPKLSKKIYHEKLKKYLSPLSIDIRYRLLLQALKLEKGIQRRDLSQLYERRDAGTEVDQRAEVAIRQRFSRRADYLYELYSIHEKDLVELVSSLPEPDIEFEFNEHLELDITHADRDDTVKITTTALIDLKNRQSWERHDRHKCLRADSHYYGLGRSLVERQTAHQGDRLYRQILAKYDSSVRSQLLREERKIKQKNIARKAWHAKLGRSIGFGILAVLGVSALALVTAQTFGLIHLVWILPTVFFAAGGSSVGVGLTGLYLNKRSRYQAVKKLARKVKNTLRSLLSFKVSQQPEISKVAQPTLAGTPGDSSATQPTVRQEPGSLSLAAPNISDESSDDSRLKSKTKPTYHGKYFEAGDAPLRFDGTSELKKRDVLEQEELRQALHISTVHNRPYSDERATVFQALRKFRESSSLWTASSQPVADHDDEAPVFSA